MKAIYDREVQSEEITATNKRQNGLTNHALRYVKLASGVKFRLTRFCTYLSNMRTQSFSVLSMTVIFV